MSPSLVLLIQEWLSLSIVVFVFWRAILRPVSLRVAHVLSRQFLKRGRVKWAMRLRAYAQSQPSRVPS